MMRIHFLLVFVFMQCSAYAQYIWDPSFEKDTLGYLPLSSPWKTISGTYLVPNTLVCKPYPAVDGSKYLGVYVREQAGMYIHQKMIKALEIGREYEIGLYIRNADTSKIAEYDTVCNSPLGATYLEVYLSQNNKNTARYIQKDSAVFLNKRKLWRSPKVDFLDWRHFKFSFVADSAYQYFFLFSTPNQKYYPYNVDYITFRATDEPEPDPPVLTAVHDGLVERRRVVLRFGKE